MVDSCHENHSRENIALRGLFHHSFVILEILAKKTMTLSSRKRKCMKSLENFGIITVRSLECSIQQSTIHPPFRSRRGTAITGEIRVV